MQVWRSRERQTGGGEAAADRPGCLGHFFVTSAGWLRGGAGKRPGRRHQEGSGCWLPRDAKQKNLASAGRVRGGALLGFCSTRAKITLVFEADPGGCVVEPGGAGCRQDQISLRNPDSQLDSSETRCYTFIRACS